MFNKRLILRTVSIILMAESIAMIPAMLLAYYDGDFSVAHGFLVTILSLVVFSFSGIMATKNHKVKIKIRESYFVVLVCWLTVIISGILPYVLSGKGYTFYDSIFESVASWTTSCAWVINASSMPRALVLWRGTASWLGGMGIILIAILIISALGVNGQRLLNAELPGPNIIKTSARMLDTIRQTYLVYSIMSVIELILLLLGKVPFFEALVNTMTSVSTAGIIDYQGAIAAHFTPYVKVVLGIFSILASVNFALLISLSKGRIKKVFEDYELRFFVLTIAGSAIFIAAMLLIHGVRRNPGTALVDGFAGVVSFASTAGFPLERVNNWPPLCKNILLILMIIGGCAGSTSGGIKVIRFAVFLKVIKRGIYKRIHPTATKPIMLRKSPVEAENVSSIVTFILLFLAVYLFSAIVMSLENMDMETTLSAPIALFTNTGVGFGKVAGGDYSIFSPLGRLYGSLLMMAGRLELYAILILFSRSFWNGDRSK